MSQASPVKVPHHTPHAPAPPGGRMFTFTDTSIKNTPAGTNNTGVPSAGNSANTSTTTNNNTLLNTNIIATPTGAAAVAQASSLYRTGSFKAPTLPKKESFSSDKGVLVRKSSLKSDTGSFKSPYTVSSSIANALGTPVSSRKVASDGMHGDTILPDIELPNELSTPQKTATDTDSTTNTTNTSASAKTSGIPTAISTTATTAVDTTYSTPRKSAKNTTATSHTTAKPAAAATSTIVSQSAFAPRRPSEIPSGAGGGRPSIRLQKANSSTAGTTGSSGATNIPTGELIAPVPRSALSSTAGAELSSGTDNATTNLDTTTSTSDSAKTPSRPIVASPPAKPVSEAKPFRRGSNSAVKKTSGVSTSNK